jgi:hypothetical protein
MSVVRCLPAPVLEAISEEVAENPGFVGEYLTPVLEGYQDPCAAVISHLSEALAEDADVAIYGLAGLGALGKSKSLKKAVKKVTNVHKKAIQKVVQVHKDIAKKAVEVVKKAPAAIMSPIAAIKPIAQAAKRTGQFVKRAADTKIARAAAAPFTFGLSTKRGMDTLRKGRDSKYAVPVIGAAGAIVSLWFPPAAAIAAVVIAGLKMKQAKQAAEAAKRAGRADAAAISAEASALQSQTSSQLDDFYRQNQAGLEGLGVTSASWYSMTIEEKIELLRQIKDGTYKPPAGSQSASDQGAAPPGGGGGSTSSSGGGGSGYAPPPTGIDQEAGEWGGGGGASGGAGSPPPSGQRPPAGGQAPVQAGLFGMSPWMLAAMAGGLILSIMQEKKKGKRRTKRNPSRRWRSCA